jgi:hypothetical protein
MPPHTDSPEHDSRHSERGQALLQVALLMVVLLSFAALAVDVGNAYGQRRRMQNAADAAALAGARELCWLNGSAAAAAAARNFLLDNGVPAEDIRPGDVVVDGNRVEAIGHIQADTFLAGIMGFSTIDVEASASSACGAAMSTCGLWPVAFDQARWLELEADGEGCGKRFVVWNDDNEAQAATCTLDGVEQTSLCGCYECDDDGDGTDDYAVLVHRGRAWLDFSEVVIPFTDPCTAPGCGTSELTCHLRSDLGAKVQLPTCISGDTGIKAGAKDDVDSRIGDAVKIALYDSLGCETSNCTGGDSFHVVNFGCVNVIGWEHNFELTPKLAEYKKMKGKVIIVEMNCDGSCATSCGSTDGRPPEPWEVRAASLLD